MNTPQLCLDSTKKKKRRSVDSKLSYLSRVDAKTRKIRRVKNETAVEIEAAAVPWVLIILAAMRAPGTGDSGGGLLGIMMHLVPCRIRARAALNHRRKIRLEALSKGIHQLPVELGLMLQAGKRRFRLKYRELFRQQDKAATTTRPDPCWMQIKNSPGTLLASGARLL